MKRSQAVRVLRFHRDCMTAAYGRFREEVARGDQGGAASHFQETLRHATRILEISLAVLEDELALHTARDSDAALYASGRDEKRARIEALARLLMRSGDGKTIH